MGRVWDLVYPSWWPPVRLAGLIGLVSVAVFVAFNGGLQLVLGNHGASASAFIWCAAAAYGAGRLWEPAKNEAMGGDSPET